MVFRHIDLTLPFPQSLEIPGAGLALWVVPVVSSPKRVKTTERERRILAIDHQVHSNVARGIQKTESSFLTTRLA
jgi:hypothetical protein